MNSHENTNNSIKSNDNSNLLRDFVLDDKYLDGHGEEVCSVLGVNADEGLLLPSNTDFVNFSITGGLNLNLSYTKPNSHEKVSTAVAELTLDLGNAKLYGVSWSNPTNAEELNFDFADAILYDNRWEAFDKWYCEELSKLWEYPHHDLTLCGAKLIFCELEEPTLFDHNTDEAEDPSEVIANEDWAELIGYLRFSAESGAKNLRHAEFGVKDEYYEKSIVVEKRRAELNAVGLDTTTIDKILKDEGLIATKQGGGVKGKSRGADGSFTYSKSKPREFNKQKCPELSDAKREQIEGSVKKDMVVKFGKPTDKASIGYMVAERDCKAGDKAIRGLCVYWNGKVSYNGKWVRVYLEQVQTYKTKDTFLQSQSGLADKGKKLLTDWNERLGGVDGFKDNLFPLPEEEAEAEEEAEVETATETTEEVAPVKKKRGRPKKKVEADA